MNNKTNTSRSLTQRKFKNRTERGKKSKRTKTPHDITDLCYTSVSSQVNWRKCCKDQIDSVCKVLLSVPQYMLLKIQLLKTKSEFTTKLKKYAY